MARRRHGVAQPRQDAEDGARVAALRHLDGLRGQVERSAEVKAQGYRLVGVELAEGAVPMHELALPADVCLAVGHEDRGLAKAALALCDDLVYLPQLGPIGSLNVATGAVHRHVRGPPPAVDLALRPDHSEPSPA